MFWVVVLVLASIYVLFPSVRKRVQDFIEEMNDE